MPEFKEKPLFPDGNEKGKKIINFSLFAFFYDILRD